MDEKTTDRVVSASLDYFGRSTFFALLVLVAGWGLGWLLGFALARSIQSKTGAAICRRLCPIIGVIAAFPLAYKLMFSA
jgi:low affinity Fe/Cu permease